MPSGRTARAYPAPDDQAPLPPAAVVAVIGAGTMGSGIAQVAAQAGHPVRLLDVRDGAAADAVRKLRLRFDDLAAKGRIARDVADAAGARLSAAATLDACADATLVVEAIVEDLAAKRALLRDLEARLAADAIVASNTSSLSITAIAAGLAASGARRRHAFLQPGAADAAGRGRQRACETRATASRARSSATAAAWGKTPGTGRTRRPASSSTAARGPFYGEALRLLAERAADAATLDAVMREAGGFRMGPFELMDLIGIDVNLSGDAKHVRGDIRRSALRAVVHPARNGRRGTSRSQERTRLPRPRHRRRAAGGSERGRLSAAVADRRLWRARRRRGAGRAHAGWRGRDRVRRRRAARSRPA